MEYLQYIGEDNHVPMLLWYRVLNLIINGIPSILSKEENMYISLIEVLNLIINGIPSIQRCSKSCYDCFKVLNLIINGIPSIRSDGDDSNPFGSEF